MASAKYYSVKPYLTISVAPGVPYSTEEKKIACLMKKPPTKHAISGNSDGKTANCICGAKDMDIGYEVLTHMMENGLFSTIDEKKQ